MLVTSRTMNSPFKSILAILPHLIMILCLLFAERNVFAQATPMKTMSSTVRLVPGTALKVAPPNIAKLAAQDEKLDAATAADNGPPADIRLTQFLTLTFDRTPSRILKAWADPDPKSDAKSSEENTPSENETPDQEPDAPQTEEQIKAAEAAKVQVAIAEEAQALGHQVALGNWNAVKEYIAKISKPEDQSHAYQHFLTALATAPPAQVPVQGVAIENQFTPTDVLAIAAMVPGEFDSKYASGLAALLRLAESAGHDINGFLESIRTENNIIGGSEPQKRAFAAELLLAAGHFAEAEEFLPDINFAGVKEDAKLLSLLTNYYTQLYESEKKATHLEKAWETNTYLLAVPETTENKTLIEAGLARAIELSLKIRDEVGMPWLQDSFSSNPQRGRQILSLIGQATSQNLITSFQDTAARLKFLKLQRATIDALLNTSPELAAEWSDTLTMLAMNWLREAELTTAKAESGSMGEIMQVDMYGNYYYVSQDQYMQRYRGSNNQTPEPIEVANLIEYCPNDTWIAHISPTVQPQLFQRFATLYLQANEEEEAFPYIEKLAQLHPKPARELVHIFLRTWTRNHDPNSVRRNRNPYIYMYGFEQKADGIPLTRSKQERNLLDLKSWVDRIRKLPIEPVEESLLANAFSTSHSSAEIYRLDSFESVFGAVGTLQPETICGLVDTMRGKLANEWRSVKNQEQMGTKRSEPELQEEVVRGYDVARELVAGAMETYPKNWKLQLAKACIDHDANDYSQSVAKRSEFSSVRDQAFADFQLAANYYRDEVQNLSAEKQSTDVYDYWFYAALGAVELGKVSEENVADDRQFPFIRAAIDSLPGELAAEHLEKFANNLFTRMSPLKPQVKFRYLKSGFAVVGDHKRAWEAKKLLEYYNDLLAEIKLDVEIDGSDRIAADEPFGVFISLVHTKEIEREAAGFDKYVQNQNNMMYAYNYGRPTENYREKFEESTRNILGEHFEIKTLIFENPKSMRSSPIGKDGWRRTRYAYALLKPLGEQVDMIPPIKLELDFLDTSGYAVLPIESPAIRIAVNNVAGEERPVSDIKITQTLDERQAADGKLIVEIKATAKGLVPELEKLVDLKFDGFDVESIDDQGVLPSEFDANNKLTILSDRSWSVQLTAASDKTIPKEFAFPSANRDVSELVFQRYKDADLVAVEQAVSLEANYAKTNLSWLVLGIVAVPVGLGLLGLLVWKISTPATIAEKQYSMPGELTPFTVIGLLKQIQHDQTNGNAKRSKRRIAELELASLSQSIKQIEQHYFGDENGEVEPNLESLARTWLAKAN